MRSAPTRPVRACFVQFFKMIFRRKITSAKIEKICCQITIAAWIFPFQYDLRCSTAKNNSITHAAAAPSNLDAATTMRSAETELQNTIRTTRNGVANCSFKTGSRRQSRKNMILKHFLKGFLEGKLLAPKLRKSAAKSLRQPGCSHSNTIYDLQLRKTIVLRMQPRHRATLTQPLQCVSQHPVANLHLSMHVATSKDDNEATIPMQSAIRDSRTAWNYAHRNNHSLQNT